MEALLFGKRAFDRDLPGEMAAKQHELHSCRDADLIRTDRYRALERFPITWNHVIERESLKFKELEHVLIEKVEQLFRDML
ncbi:MAG: hypothetical protein ACRECP_09355 [Methylocella sp.]